VSEHYRTAEEIFARVAAAGCAEVSLRVRRPRKPRMPTSDDWSFMRADTKSPPIASSADSRWRSEGSRKSLKWVLLARNSARTCEAGRRRYIIFYTDTETSLLVLRVVHGARRDPASALQSLNLTNGRLVVGLPVIFSRAWPPRGRSPGFRGSDAEGWRGGTM